MTVEFARVTMSALLHGGSAWVPSLPALRPLVLDRWLFDWRQRGADRLPRSELEALQERRLRALLAYVVEHSPFYARLYRGIDVARAPLAEFPPVDKPTLMERWDEVVTDRSVRRAELERFVVDAGNVGRYFRGRYFPMMTSGTTGMRGLFLFGGADTAWRYFAGRRAARVQRHRPTRRRAEVMPHSLTANAYWSRRAMPGWNPRTRSFDVLGQTPELVAALNRYQPDSLTSYASQLEILALEQLAGRLHISPHTVFSRLEVLTEEMRSTMKRAWGAPVRDCYVAAEVGVVAVQCTVGEFMHVFEDLLVLEIEDPEEAGAAGREEGGPLLITSLTGRAFPIIRYRIGDRAELTDDPCPCGWTLRRLRRVYGRDVRPFYFRRSDGSWLPLHRYVFEELIRGWAGVRRFHLRHEPAGITLLAVPQPGMLLQTAEMEERIQRVLEVYGAVPPPIRVLAVAEVELRRRCGGKLTPFVSLVEPPASP